MLHLLRQNHLQFEAVGRVRVHRAAQRTPGAGLVFAEFLRENVSDRAVNRELDFVKVGTLSRIPGWSILDHIERNCSEI